jgi:hypothetical protein
MFIIKLLFKILIEWTRDTPPVAGGLRSIHLRGTPHLSWIRKSSMGVFYPGGLFLTKAQKHLDNRWLRTETRAAAAIPGLFQSVFITIQPGSCSVGLSDII